MAARNGGLPGADENAMPGIGEMFEQATAFEIGLMAAGAVLTLAVLAFFAIAIWAMHRQQQRRTNETDDVDDQPDRDAKT